MKAREIAHLFSTLDPEADVTISVWVRDSGARKPPRRIGGDPKPHSWNSKLTNAQLREVRALAYEHPFTEIALKFGVHRATISRYIHAEFRANRMGQSGRGFVPSKGAYDQETGEPILVKP